MTLHLVLFSFAFPWLLAEWSSFYAYGPYTFSFFYKLLVHILCPFSCLVISHWSEEFDIYSEYWFFLPHKCCKYLLPMFSSLLILWGLLSTWLFCLFVWVWQRCFIYFWYEKPVVSTPLIEQSIFFFFSPGQLSFHLCSANSDPAGGPPHPPPACFSSLISSHFPSSLRFRHTFPECAQAFLSPHCTHSSHSFLWVYFILLFYFIYLFLLSRVSTRGTWRFPG